MQEQQDKQQKNLVIFKNVALHIAKICHTHALLSHKMALALCAQLAHLSVLKLRTTWRRNRKSLGHEQAASCAAIG